MTRTDASSSNSAADTRASGRRGQRGFALLVVLWTVALLALLGTAITAAARSAASRSAALRGAAVAQAAADGLVREAAFHLLDQSPARWLADGTLRPIKLARGTALVRVSDEDARLNPNTMNLPTLNAFLRMLGIEGAAAQQLSGAIAGWHLAVITGAAQYRAAGLPYGPPHQRFSSLEELRLVLGMTPALYDRMAPYLSVYTDGHVDLAQADPLVVRVVQQAGRDAPPPPDPGAPQTVSIDVRVTLPDGSARRHAVLQIDPTDDDPANVCYVVAWD